MMEKCLVCKNNSLITNIDKYAIVKHCDRCGYFMPKYFECCSNPNIENVIYNQNDTRKTIREQCVTCGKRLNKPPISFSKIHMESLKLFNEELFENRRVEVNDIKQYYDGLIKGNNGRIRYNLFESYYYTNEWKELRQKVFQRDNYKCLKCGAKAEQVHHETYERFKAEKIEDLSSICVPCHNLIHSK